MAFGLWFRWLLALLCLVGLAACSSEPVNSPYPEGVESQNTLFTAFTQRSPKHLDPASSYSADESPFTYAIYEPLYGYHYLKRPYELVPCAARQVVAPRYYGADGKRLPDDAPGDQVATSVYDMPLRPGIRFQPHPVFARRADGSYRYWPLAPADLEGKYGMDAFPETGTRELTAH